MRPLVIALLAGLVLASSASAKEVTGATICGADDCRTVGAEVGHDVFPDSIPAEAPAAAPFVRVSVDVRVEDGEEVTVESVFVPSLGLLGGEGGWMRPVDEGALATLERLARGLEPWPASELPGAAPQAASAPAPAPPPAPVDRSSPTWVVAGLGAVLALLGLAAFAGGRRHRGGGSVALR
jgi:hypothetical protein